MTWLWTLLHDLFDTDDGTLPELDLPYSSREALAEGYAAIVAKSHSLMPEDATVERIDGRTVPVATLKNPAALVAWGQAKGLHVLAAGVTLNGTVLPDLGLSVSSKEITLDYRMGDAWGPTHLQALFSLLAEATRRGMDSRPSVLAWWGVDAETRFQSGWARYLKEHQ